ncbi:MAG: hypothetical protein LBG44_05365 [Gemmatimonadota bacterium]|jgi:hypothetical protein|nr:hypothetical protein [Gemmatimonadota bacterium]
MVVLGGCAPRIAEIYPVAPAGARCYALAYTPVEADGLFPALIALEPGDSGGGAVWLPTPIDSLGIWRMFQRPTRWEVLTDDSLVVSFHNGFSGALLRLFRSATGTLLAGNASWTSDVVGPDLPRASLTGQETPCPAP